MKAIKLVHSPDRVLESLSISRAQVKSQDFDPNYAGYLWAMNQDITEG